MLLKHDQIGLKILDWSSISRVVLNQRVTTNDPKGLCCSTNYSAAWDLDDELIVFATDNLFCNDTVETLLKVVLDPERKWENLTQAINRVHRHGPYVHEDYYTGNYPGVTSRLISHTVAPLLLLRRCFQPYLETILDFEQMYSIRQAVESHILHEPNRADDHIDPVIMVLDSNSDSDSDSDSDSEFDSNDDETNMDPVEKDFQLFNNPIIPKYGHSFFASAAVPPENLTYMHSSPHTDGVEVGLASVYTLTKNKSYHATATTFNRLHKSKDTILTTNLLLKNFGTEVRAAQEKGIAAGESPYSGWLNTSANRFSEIVAMAYNAHNRFIIYPSNRLHTAYIPDRNLLNSDPSLGRLSLNTFWHTYTIAKKFCNSISQHVAVTQLKRHSTVARTPEEVLKLCTSCTVWENYCGWCASTMECIGRDDEKSGKSSCPSNQIVGAFGSNMNLTCQDAAEKVSKCMPHTDCKSCADDGCVWCSAVGVCKAAYTGKQKKGQANRWNNPCLVDKSNSIQPYQAENCRTGYRNYDCNAHVLCHTCHDNGCAYCFETKQCMQDTEPSLCEGQGGNVATLRNNITLLNDHLKCPPILTNLKLKSASASVEECKQQLNCNSCIDVIGCAWCIEQNDNSVGKCIPDGAKVCAGPEGHFTKDSINTNQGQKSVCTAVTQKNQLQLPDPAGDGDDDVESVSGVEGGNGGKDVALTAKDTDGTNEASFKMKGRFLNSYVLGTVLPIKTQKELDGLLAFHSHTTGIPLIVEFVSEDCGPCKAFQPIYKKAANKYKGHLAFYTIDIDANSEMSVALADHYSITIVPSFLFFESGKQSRTVNSIDPTSLLAIVEEVVHDSKLKGTYVNKYVTEESLIRFYEQHDVEKVNDAGSIIDTFGRKTAKLMRLLKKLYGKIPELNEYRKVADYVPIVSGLSDFSIEQLKEELKERELWDDL